MSPRSLLPRLSISTRLTLWFGLSLLVLLSLFVAVLYTSVHVGLHDDLESRLTEEAEAIQAHFEAHSNKQQDVSASYSHEVQAASGTYVRLLGTQGEVIRSSPAFQARPPLPVDLPATPGSTLRARRWGDTAAQSLYVSVDNNASPVAWMEVTKLQSPIHRQLHDLRWLLILGIGIGVGVATLVGYGLARRALRPVASLTAAARKMQERSSGTLPTDFGVEDELTELADTFNDLIGRLRESLERERRFRADAAHNMFTPLTAIQSEIDVTLRSERSPSTYRETLRTIRQHAGELSSILDRLMTLSQVEAGARGRVTTDIEVGERLRTRVDSARERSGSTKLVLTVDADRPIEAPVHPSHLDLIVDHLLENALKYTSDEGTIQVHVTRTDSDAVIRVSDDGMGFPPEAADRLFDRFYRGSNAEERSSGGGLGLSLVQAVVRSYDGSVCARSPGPGQGSTFEVTLPL